jgi:hypothetical protein
MPAQNRQAAQLDLLPAEALLADPEQAAQVERRAVRVAAPVARAAALVAALVADQAVRSAINLAGRASPGLQLKRLNDWQTYAFDPRRADTTFE